MPGKPYIVRSVDDGRVLSEHDLALEAQAESEYLTEHADSREILSRFEAVKNPDWEP